MLYQSNLIEQEYDALSLIRAVQAWNYLTAVTHLDGNVIKEVHKILMWEKGLGRNCGQYRDCIVFVGSHIAPEPFLVPHLIANWILDYGNNTLSEEQIKEAHIAFETIHPFVDGNGRVGRMLLNWQRHKAGLPTLIIKEVNKQSYYQWFANR